MKMKKKLKNGLVFFLTGVLLAGMLPLSGLQPVQASSIILKNPVKGENEITTWDCVWFGDYWQEDTNGDGKADTEDEQTPIKWRVLSVTGDDAFLMADKNLDCVNYNDTRENVTWETCTIRSWLNGYWEKENTAGNDYRGEGFIDYAFTEEESQAIKTVNVKNGYDSVMGVDGGNDTSDKIYLLSAEEAADPAYGFAASKPEYAKSRRVFNTAFARAHGAYQSDSEELMGCALWWLRPAFAEQNAAYVGSYGDIYNEEVFNRETGVRPVLHLDLSAAGWSYAGTVTSEGTADETIPPQPTPKPVEPGLKNPVKDKKGITTWDCLWFGNYWQEDTNGDGKADKEDEQTPIKWRILSVKDGDAFLMADKNLDCVNYNDTRENVTWETCTIRSWLNGYWEKENAAGKDYRGEGFIDYAFTDSENQAIKTVNVKNGDDSLTGSNGGNDTSDKIYFLSAEEAMTRTYGFAPSDKTYAKNRRVENTAFAKARGAHQSDNEDLMGYALWWLRSPGPVSQNAAYAGAYGYIHYVEVFNRETGVRPVLHLDLSAAGWSYAGTVTSEGEVNEEAPLPNESTDEKPKPDKSELENPVKDKKGITTWDCVWFGNYWQEDTNGDGKANTEDEKTPIKWRVLSVKDGDAFLMADKNLDCVNYNDTRENVTWETCTIRSWLNGYWEKENAAGKDYRGEGFIDYAFTDSENQAIKTVNVKNGDDSLTGSNGGNDTSDKIYFLSAEEAMTRTYGFAPSDKTYAKNRRVENTAFAKARGAHQSDNEDLMGYALWWLRSPGPVSQNAAYAGAYGYIHYVEVFNRETGVRPVLHLDLSVAAEWSYAGTVTSEEAGFSIELNQKYLNLCVGEQEQISAKISAAEAYELQWMSTNEDVVSVDAGGRVTAVSAGTAEIKAVVTYNDRKYNVNIPVTVSGFGGSTTPTATPAAPPATTPTTTPAVPTTTPATPTTTPVVPPTTTPAVPTTTPTTTPAAPPATMPTTAPAVPTTMPAVPTTTPAVPPTATPTTTPAVIPTTTPTATPTTTPAKRLDACQIGLDQTEFVYDGKPKTPIVTIKDGNIILEAGKDYTTEYLNNINAGTATAVITGINNYAGVVMQTFAIQKAQQKISCNGTYEVNQGDKPFLIGASVDNNEGVLTYQSSDKKAAIVNAKGNVTVKGCGIAIITMKAAESANYLAASATTVIKISPKKMKLSTLKSVRKGRLQMKWKKSASVTGYVIQYALNSKFKKGVKTIRISGSNQTSSVTLKLKKGKRYYVRIRAYKKVQLDGRTKMLYGKWSAKKSKKVK